MKVNNEYINASKFNENIYGSEKGENIKAKTAFISEADMVNVTKAENANSQESYNKYGEETDSSNNQGNCEQKGFSIENLQESIRNILGEMDGSEYEKLEKLGLSATDDGEEFVTVYERIQIQLMTYCENYNYAGTGIDTGKMEKVLGSKSMASAVAKASDIKQFGDSAKEYMLNNNLEPTVDNVYKAVHSLGIKQEESTGKEVALGEDMVKAVSDKLVSMGYEPDETNMSNGMWLVAHEIPLTEANMTKLAELNQIDNMSAEELSKNIAYSMYYGLNSGNAFVTDRYSDMESVEDVVKTIENADENVAEHIASENKPLNIMNLKAAAYYSSITVTSSKGVVYRQTIVEAKLLMTTSSVFNLKRLGMDIAHMDIDKMNDMIKSENNKLIESFLDNTGIDADPAEKNIISQTFEIMNSFASIPSAVAAKVYSQEISFTMTEIHAEGTSMIATQFASATTAYETFGTQVRRDLGDSYRKAFSNVDNLLLENNMELNEANRRAVRILGYNSMEITTESVTKVREIAAELDYLVDNLNPKTAVHLIKNGINPLKDNIRDVNDMLLHINEEIGKTDESYGEYLWKLEKAGIVDEDERKNYIELYRILSMVCKNDGNVIGMVMEQGGDMTLKNLYSAYKSKKAAGMDVNLDNSETVSYVKKSLTTFLENISVESAEKLVNDGMDISLENALDMNNEDSIEEAVDEYYEERVKMYESVQELSAKEMERIVKNLDTKSISDIYAYMNISKGNSFYKKLKENEDTDKIVTTIEEALDKDGDIDELGNLYEELENAGKGTEVNSTLEFRNKKVMMSSLKMLKGLANKNSYFVPVEIDGETTNVHLTISANTSVTSNVTVSFSNTALGSVSSKFMIEKSVLTGSIAVDNRSTEEIVKDNISLFVEKLDNFQIKTERIDVFHSESEVIFENMANYDVKDKDEEEKNLTEMYYSVAKAFISSVKIWAKTK